MDRYLIETPHTGPECLVLIKLINAQGYLSNFDWGCEAGIHSGWAIIEGGKRGTGSAGRAAPGARSSTYR